MSFPTGRIAMRTLAVVALAALPTAPAVAGSAETASPACEERVAQLEARVAELETFLASALGYGTEAGEKSANAGPLTLPVVVTRKHFKEKDPAHARWEDSIDLDLEYDTAVLTKPAAAMRGTLVFADTFGEAQFEMPVEITDSIDPARKLKQKNVRFNYNQFRESHQWMHATDAGNMQVSFRISTVRYVDGTKAEYR